MKAKDVVQYLQDHPEFFEKNAEILENIHVPHPHDERVISFSERQTIKLRDKNQVLQDKLLELINFGEENDAISEKMHRLSIALLTFTSLDELLYGINFNLTEDFAIPHIAIRLWNTPCNDQELPEFSTTSDDIHTIAESLLQPYCGLHVADEIKHWFGDKDATQIHSFSMIPLRTTRTFGLLVLGSPEPQRFFPEMGTLHIKRLGDLVSTALTRHTS